MAIKKPIPISFNLDGQYSVQSVCAVIHIDDKNTETLDLSLMQGGEHIAVSQNSTVTARFVRVKDKILISDNVACTVQENGNIHIPIDNAAAHMLVGEIKIEVNIVDENDILTMQFPLVIRVNNTILADAEISPESEGTIPELLEEAREAAESATQAAEAATEAISAKQDKLTAGDNITISEENVISASSGSNDYTELENKPSINNVTLSGNKTSDDLNLQGKLTAGENITISSGNVISAEGGGVTSYEDLTDKPQIKIKVQDAESTELGLVDVDIEGIFNLPYGFKLYYDSVGGKSLGLYEILTESLNDAKNFLVGQHIYSPYKYDFNTLSNDFRRAGMWEATALSCMHVPSFITSSFVSGYSNYDFFIIHYYAHAHVAGGAPMIRSVAGKDKNGDFRIYYQYIRLSDNNDGTISNQSDWVELTGGGVTSYNDLTDKPYVTINDYSGTLPPWAITNGIHFAPYQFSGIHTVDGKINVFLDNLISRYHFEPLPYDFNKFSTAPYNGCLELRHSYVSNFPNALNKIDTSKPYFLTQHFDTLESGNRERHAFRKVSGYSRDGDFIEYAQICYIDYPSDLDNEIISQTDWVELTGGGAQIVSGVVNANGTITFTDSEGNSFTTSGSNLVTSGNEQISMGYDNGGFYFLFDDGQEEVNNGTD